MESGGYVADLIGRIKGANPLAKACGGAEGWLIVAWQISDFSLSSEDERHILCCGSVDVSRLPRDGRRF